MSLDAAWAEVEAALPTVWWYIRSLTRLRDGWEVVAAEPNKGIVVAHGPTPAAALRALAARLRGA